MDLRKLREKLFRPNKGEPEVHLTVGSDHAYISLPVRSKKAGLEGLLAK